MKKFYATLLMATMAMAASAQETNDTTYVMFDFNKNPWNYPTTGVAEKGWNPDYDDSKGFILKTTTFDWAIADGAAEKVSVIVTPPADFDPEEGLKPALLYYGPDYDQKNDGSISATKLWMNPGFTIRFKAPDGYKFGKMLFYFYRNTYFVIDTEEEVPVVRDGVEHKDNLKVWIPSTPKVNQNNLECWQGDETDILFDYPYMKGVFEKIDMRLVPNGTTGITDINVRQSANKIYDIQGRRLKKTPHHGIYIDNGKKIVR